MKRDRIGKTIEAVKRLYGNNKTTKIQAIYKDTNNNDYVVFFKTRKTHYDEFAKKDVTLTHTEYVTMNNRYVWGMRVGYFCTLREETRHFEQAGHYVRIL